MINYLAPLPYAEKALAPLITEETVHYHYGKHQKNYAETTQKLVAGTRFENWPLEDIIYETRLSAHHVQLFNNAAQTWNHMFFWEGLAPHGSDLKPQGALLEQINRDYGSLENLQRALIDTAALHFGSGWLWIVDANGRLNIRLSANAETYCSYPHTTPIFVLDLWEHAYYLDWRNRRGDYVEATVKHLINWDAIARRFEYGRLTSKLANGG